MLSVTMELVHLRLQHGLNFKDQGIDEKTWKDSLHDIAVLAYEDQCSPANPRLPIVTDMEEIMADAYYGYAERPGRRK